jgi:hypothetical protein
VGGGNDNWLAPFGGAPRGAKLATGPPLGIKPPSRPLNGRFFGGDPSRRSTHDDSLTAAATAQRVDEVAAAAFLKRLAEVLRPQALLDKSLQQARSR